MTAQMPIPWDYLQENLVTQAEIARRLGIDDANVTNWKRRDDWPAPVLVFSQWSVRRYSDLFWWPEVRDFCVRHNVTPGKGMQRGRPKKLAEKGHTP